MMRRLLIALAGLVVIAVLWFAFKIVTQPPPPAVPPVPPPPVESSSLQGGALDGVRGGALDGVRGGAQQKAGS